MAGTCRIPNMVAFVEGRHNGESYDESDIDELVANFGRLRGYWAPYVAFGHASYPNYQQYAGLSFGDVTAVRKGRVRFDPTTGQWTLTADAGPHTRAALLADAENVPKEFGELVHTRRLPRRSIELFDHTCPLIDPAGKPVLSNVLKCVSFLGSHPEAVKGMPPAAVEFGDLSARGRPLTHPHRPPARAKCFGADPMPTKEMILQALTQAGVDPAALNDAVLDAVMQALTASAAPPPDPNAPPPGPPVDAKAFGDIIAKTVAAQVNAAVAKATAPIAPALAHLTRAAADAKAAKIQAFGDRATLGDRPTMTPVQFAAIRPMLELADDVAVKAFGDKKTPGTALDEQLAALAAAYTVPVKAFGDRVPDPLAGANGTTYAGDRRAALLKTTPEGRQVLKREADAARK